MAVKKRWIKVKTSFRGIHNWPECDLQMVEFLKHPHRHTFKVEVKIAVSHNDREVEFLILQRDVDWAIKDILEDLEEEGENIPNLGRKSCEEMAEDIYKYLCYYAHYRNREMIITVSEDGEVAAEIEFIPDKS